MTKNIAMTVSASDGMAALMDERFGRAPFFLVVNEDGQTSAVLENNVQGAVHGAGTYAAQLMAGKNITDVISGQFGPKAYAALEKLNIQMWTAPSGLTANEALAEFNKGNLVRFQMKVF